MKTILKIGLIIVIIAISNRIGFCDTIDYYHVYYNNKKIKEYNQHDLNKENSISFQTNSIKKSDKLTVKYFNDTPCRDCKFFIQVKSQTDDKIISENSNIGQFEPLTINLNDLVKFQKFNQENIFGVYYYEKDKSNIRQLFKIKLE